MHKFFILGHLALFLCKVSPFGSPRSPRGQSQMRTVVLCQVLFQGGTCRKGLYSYVYIYIFILSTKNSINSSFIYFKKTEAYLSTHSPCITMFFLKIDCCRELGILNFFKEITPWCSKTLLRVYFVQGFGGLFIPPEKVFGAQHTTVFFP